MTSCQKVVLCAFLIFLSCDSTFAQVNCTAGSGFDESGTCAECEEGFFGTGEDPFKCEKCMEGWGTFGSNKTSSKDCQRNLASIPTWYFQILTFTLIMFRVVTAYQRQVLIGRLLGKGETSELILGFCVLLIGVEAYLTFPTYEDSYKTTPREAIAFWVSAFLNLVLTMVALVDKEFKKSKTHVLQHLFAGIVLMVALVRSFQNRHGFGKNDVIALILLFLALEVQTNTYLDGFRVIGDSSSNWEMRNAILSFLIVAAFLFIGLPVLFNFGMYGKPSVLEKNLEGNVWVAQALFAVITGSISLVAQFIGALQSSHSESTLAADVAFNAVLHVQDQEDMINCMNVKPDQQGVKRFVLSVGEFFDQGRHTILCKWLGLIHKEQGELVGVAAYMLGRPDETDACEDATDQKGMQEWLEAEPKFDCDGIDTLTKLMIEATKLSFKKQEKIDSLAAFLTQSYAQSWILQLFVITSLFGAIFNTVRHGSNMQGRVDTETRDHVFTCIVVLSGVFFLFLGAFGAMELHSRDRLVKTVSRFETTNDEKHKFRSLAFFKVDENGKPQRRAKPVPDHHH